MFNVSITQYRKYPVFNQTLTQNKGFSGWSVGWCFSRTGTNCSIMSDIIYHVATRIFK